jgi:hypothetical protein
VVSFFNFFFYIVILDMGDIGVQSYRKTSGFTITPDKKCCCVAINAVFKVYLRFLWNGVR